VVITDGPFCSYPVTTPNRLKSEYNALEKSLWDTRYALLRNKAELACYREEHPWKMRLHNLQIMPDKELIAKQRVVILLKAEHIKLEKAFEKSKQENMRAFLALYEAKNKALPAAFRKHEREEEYFRDVDSIYQPLKERDIAKEELCRREQEQVRKQEREKEHQYGQKPGGDSGRYLGR
jgi:hypothetical protein